MAGNPFKRLREILGTESVEVATVQADNGNGTSDVTLLGGGRITVSGDGYTPGGRVFIKSGDIVSAAPALPVVTVEV